MPSVAVLGQVSRWTTGGVIPPPEVKRLQYGLRICRLHRVVYVDDDRFPAPCAKWGGHDPQNPA